MRSFSVASVIAFVALAAACSGSDPSALTLGHGQWGGSGAGAPSDDAGGGGGSAVDSGAVGTGAEAGAPDAHADAMNVVPSDAGPPNAFTGAPAYASAPPVIDAQSQHGFSLVGRSCFDCHGGANPSSGKRFDYAGRVFADANGQTPAADVEVRVVDHNGVASSAHSDGSGYFWHRASADLALPALAGVRNASATTPMIGALSDPSKLGGCNGCHDGTTTRRLHVP